MLPDLLQKQASGTVTILPGTDTNTINLNIPNITEDYSFELQLNSVNDPDFTIGLSDGSKITSIPILVIKNRIQLSIDENPNNGQLITNVATNIIEGATYSLKSEGLINNSDNSNIEKTEGIFSLDETSGELRVRQRLFFNWEQFTTLIAEVEIKFLGITIATKTIEVNLNDITLFWTGPKTTFVYEGGGVALAEENQDRITNNVWIARGPKFSIFNAAPPFETQFTPNPNGFSPSPITTLWAIGTIADGVENLDFKTFKEITGKTYNYINTNGNKPLVVFLVQDDTYLELTWIDWHRGTSSMPDGAPGGFSYKRSTAP